jgi:hypothetical protein
MMPSSRNFERRPTLLGVYKPDDAKGFWILFMKMRRG